MVQLAQASTTTTSMMMRSPSRRCGKASWSFQAELNTKRWCCRSISRKFHARFPGLRILIGDIPADQAPARWKFGDAEFRFYFNDTDSAKEYAIGSGSLELWDPHTGYVTPYKQDRMLLEPGQARLLLRK